VGIRFERSSAPSRGHLIKELQQSLLCQHNALLDKLSHLVQLFLSQHSSELQLPYIRSTRVQYPTRFRGEILPVRFQNPILNNLDRRNSENELLMRYQPDFTESKVTQYDSNQYRWSIIKHRMKIYNEILRQRLITPACCRRSGVQRYLE
jgi:hypothetical protein